MKVSGYDTDNSSSSIIVVLIPIIPIVLSIVVQVAVVRSQ